MQVTITLEEQELKDFLEWKDNIKKDLWRKSGISYVWDAEKNDWVTHKHYYTNGIGDIMSQKLLRTLGYHPEVHKHD